MMDNASRLLSTALNIVFIGHPARTSLGVVVGLALQAIVQFFTPLLSKYVAIVDPHAVSSVEYMILGVAILHAPTIYFYLFQRRGHFDESLEYAFGVIAEARAHGVSKAEVRQMYRRLCEKALQNVALKPSTHDEIRRFLEEDHRTDNRE